MCVGVCVFTCNTPTNVLSVSVAPHRKGALPALGEIHQPFNQPEEQLQPTGRLLVAPTERNVCDITRYGCVMPSQQAVRSFIKIMKVAHNEVSTFQTVAKDYSIVLHCFNRCRNTFYLNVFLKANTRVWESLL